jgi:hypothetical protein
VIPVIELRAIGPSEEIAVLLAHLRALSGVEVASVSGAMRSRTAGSVRYYLSARLDQPRPAPSERR